MTEKLKKVQEFVESLENSSDFESCVVLNSSYDDGNAMGGNGTCSGKNLDKCVNSISCTKSENSLSCSNSNYCEGTNATCNNTKNCPTENSSCTNNDTCRGSNNNCTAGNSGGSNNGNSIGFPGFGFM